MHSLFLLPGPFPAVHLTSHAPLPLSYFWKFSPLLTTTKNSKDFLSLKLITGINEGHNKAITQRLIRCDSICTTAHVCLPVCVSMFWLMMEFLQDDWMVILTWWLIRGHVVQLTNKRTWCHFRSHLLIIFILFYLVCIQKLNFYSIINFIDRIKRLLIPFINGAIQEADKKFFPAVKSKMFVTWKEAGKPWCEYYHQPDKWLFFSGIVGNVGQFHTFSRHLEGSGQSINQTRTIMVFYHKRTILRTSVRLYLALGLYLQYQYGGIKR